MNDLVKLHNGIPSTTQSVIAQYSENSEESIQRLIRTHKESLEKFGKVEFTIEKIVNSKNKVNSKKLYYLNEQQSYLFMTFLKNTPIVVSFKEQLIKEFFELRAQAIIPTPQPDITTILVDLVKTSQQQNETMLQAINNQTTMFKALQKQIAELSRSVSYNSDVMYATQEAINMSQKKQSNPTYPMRVPHIAHPDMPPFKLTYMQKKTLIAIEELIGQKQYYEIIDGEEYYRVKGVELTSRIKKNSVYITNTLNTLAQYGYIKKVKLNHVCSVYALVPKKPNQGKK
jgi:phage regulator Rha-like protein